MVAHEGTSEAFARLLELEPAAAGLWQNQPMFVPGLLQTEDYAAAVIAAVTGRAPADPVLAGLVELRMRRATAFAERLRGDDPPGLTVVIDESVLLRRVLPAEAMARQLALLREAAGLPSVRLGVMPLAAGATGALAGGFEVLGDAAVFFESAEGDRIATGPEVVRGCRDRAEALFAAAASGSGASALIERAVHRG
ncbi:DUF5753 domain-containing protein [Symbioplanes lichenis]|uniref:DUF5753 domain-containing protein n=1 Tax=Symbioplanes lichenis TaxID=1629072 RepID=UPI00273878E0|nr:DUF5753 domain-containing protein [Actinoplanes lichenis]